MPYMKMNQKREVADKMLIWLIDNNQCTWNSSYDLPSRASNDLNEPIYNLWKSYQLLRKLGRIELITSRGG